MAESKKTKWVLIFLINADFRTNDGLRMNKEIMAELNELLADLFNCTLSNHLIIYLVFNSIRFVNEQMDSFANIDTETLILRLDEKTKSLKNKYNNIFVDINTESDASSDITNDDELIKIFKKIRNDVKFDPKARKLIITWAHGSAFGIFKDVEFQTPQVEVWEYAVNEISKFEYLEELFNQHPLLKGVKRESGKNYKIVQQGYQTLATNNDEVVSILSQITTNNEPVFVEQKDNNSFVFSFYPNDENIIDYAKHLNEIDQSSLSYKFRMTNNFEISSNPEPEKTTTSLKILSESPDIDLFFINNEVSSSLPSVSETSFVDSRITSSLDFFKQNINAVAATVSTLENQSTTFKILTNEELAKALSNVFGSIDILMMMNCFMMNLMNAYAVKDCVKHLIATQGSISAPGFNYQDIVKCLLHHPNSKTVNISRRFLNSTFNKRAYAKGKKFPRFTNSTFRQWGLFLLNFQVCNSLGKNSFGELLTQLGNLIDILTEKVNGTMSDLQIKTVLNCARRLTYCFDKGFGYELVDLVNWCKIIRTIISDIEIDAINNLKGELDNLSNKIALEISQSGLFYHYPFKVAPFFEYETTAGVVTCHEPTGIAITFPFSIRNNPNLVQLLSISNLLLTEMNQWVSFCSNVCDFKITTALNEN
jgi:Clostripain family